VATRQTGGVTPQPLALSILDLAIVQPGETARDAFEASVAIAQRAEARGYRRVWYAEHHNMAAIASSSPAVLIAHVAAHTSTIRLGAGGVMLPNHSPLTIAEQFGTLAALHPGRIDLGLGRAPGTDQVTWRAMRRDINASDQFPRDVVELQSFLGDRSSVAGVDAIPGKGTHVPLYILGSSLFGAQLAAQLGLPFAFASHFAPELLVQAIALYRKEFQPSPQHHEPHAMAALNIVAAQSEADAARQLRDVHRRRVRLFLGRGQQLSDDDVERLVDSPQGRQIRSMMHYTAVGTPEQVADAVNRFRDHADADELITAHAATSATDRLRSIDLLADALIPCAVR
jgi:luciferase family oxidoreductase group 1